jgi:predicted S18 family serine protease
MLSVLLLAAASAAFGQAKMSNESKLEAKITALEQKAWQAWKDRNVAYLRANTTETFLSISSEGVSDKAQVLKAAATECRIKSFSLHDVKFVMLDQNVVALTYTATQDAVCNGKKAPAKIRAVVNYVKRGDRWLEAMYMQAP